MSRGNYIGLTTMAIIFSVFSFVLFTKISRDILFEGLNFCSSSIQQLLFGSLTLTASAMITGFMASLLVMRRNHLPHFIISAVIVVHLVTSTSCTFWTAPFFFETGIHASMLAGLWLGNHGARKFPLVPA